MKKSISKKFVDYNWILKIIIISFLISILFSFIAETAIPNVNIIFGVLLTLIFIFIGIIFDMIGVSVASADESKFHSMASKKIRGAKMAIKLKRNADKVSSFCNDVVGDICGIISGSTGTVIAIKLIEIFKVNDLLVTLIVVGFISSLTIGGKALVKGIAMRKSDKILFIFAKFLNFFRNIN